MWAFCVAECGLDHDKFWQLSWFEFSLYARRHKIRMQELKAIDEGHWARFRIQWADFRNANSSKKSKTVKPTDLVKLSFDERSPDEIVIPDIEAVKRKFGAKLKKKDGIK